MMRCLFVEVSRYATGATLNLESDDPEVFDFANTK